MPKPLKSRVGDLPDDALYGDRPEPDATGKTSPTMQAWLDRLAAERRAEPKKP